MRVLVVGASIAGPASAYWLARAGAEVTVIERFPELRTGGQAVDIRLAGVTAMRKMGIEASVREKNPGEEGMRLVRKDGTPYGTIRTTGNPERQGLLSEYEIFRGDLSAILVDLSKHVDYRFGITIESIHDDSVNFSDGSSGHFDLIVACDGATSRTRAMAFGCGIRDHIVPSNAWAAYWTMKHKFLNGSKIATGISAPQYSISLGTDPAGPERAMVLHYGDASGFRNAKNVKEYIAKEVEDLGWHCRGIAQDLIESDDLYSSEIVQVKMESHHRGNVVLVGDAGYAAGPTGCGTSLALTGAYILAGEITRHQDLPSALNAYEERMKPLIKSMQRIPPFALAVFIPQTWWGLWVRNQIFSWVAWSGIAEWLQGFFGGGFGDVKDYPLPEYDWPA